MPADKLTADQLVARLAFETGTTKEIARMFLGAVNTVTRAALISGASVTIPGLVRLTPKTRAARLGRNPGTGETFSLPAKRVVAARLMPSLTLPQD